MKLLERGKRRSEGDEVSDTMDPSESLLGGHMFTKRVSVENVLRFNSGYLSPVYVI